MIKNTKLTSDDCRRVQPNVFSLGYNQELKGPMMAQAKYGDEVKVHYTGRLTGGRVFASSVEGDPMVLTIGQEKMFFDFEQALIGMSPGESKKIAVTSDRAYGPYREDLVK